MNQEELIDPKDRQPDQGQESSLFTDAGAPIDSEEDDALLDESMEDEDMDFEEEDFTETDDPDKEVTED